MAHTPLPLRTTSIGYISWVLLATILKHFAAQSNASQQFFSPEVCCGDVPLKMDDHSQCCGNSSYSSVESMCCWETRRGHYVLSLPVSPTAAAVASPATNSVVQVKRRNSSSQQADAARFLACCHDKLYDFRFYTCCDGVVRKQSLNGNTGCCGRHVYDPYSQLCCQSRILPKATFSSYCCGHKSYDNTREVCCGDVVFPGGKSSSSSTSSPNALSCCGNGTYDIENELCCGGGVRLQKRKPTSYCCGTDQFDWDTETCCNGVVHSKTSETELCCARQTYDSATHICCTDTIIPRRRMNKKGSTAVAVSQNLRLSRRRFDILTTSDDESELCCGNNTTYDFDTEICCDGRVFERNDPTLSSSSLSTETGSASDSNTKCCGKQLFRDDREICCEGRVLSKATRAEDCCGPTVFNVQNQVCCQGVIHDLVESDALLYCCGNSTFHPLKQTCCNGKKSAKVALLSNEA